MKVDINIEKRGKGKNIDEWDRDLKNIWKIKGSEGKKLRKDQKELKLERIRRKETKKGSEGMKFRKDQKERKAR